MGVVLRQPLGRAAASSSRASCVRQTAAWPSGIVRPCPGSSGMTKNVSRSCGCTAAAKPNSVGSPSVISVQVRPPSSLTGACRRGSAGTSGRRRPASGRACGRRSRPPRARAASRRAGPRFRGVQVAPPSVVSKSADPLHDRPEAVGVDGVGRGAPRCRDGPAAGSPGRPSPRCPAGRRASRGASTSLRRRVLSKIPGASTPTSSRPCAAASVETFESLRPSRRRGPRSIAPRSRRGPALRQTADAVPLARGGGEDRRRVGSKTAW